MGDQFFWYCWGCWRSARSGARRSFPRVLQLFLTAALAATASYAQIPLSSKAQADALRLFSKENTNGTLDCHIETRKPFLDFSFRYEIGYIVRCGLAQFQGNEATLGMLLRIAPLHGAPITLGQSFTVPTAPEEVQRHVNIKRLRAEIQFSAVYAAGEGAYENDVVIVDPRNRAYRKKWRSRTEGWAAGEASPMSIKPLEVESISLPHWKGLLNNGHGLHLTLLLDAAPVSRYSATLRAWDRAFLLGAVSSVLRQLPLASVRLIAFNLDQQREIFREEQFDATGIAQLANTLADVELGTISYKTLQRDKGWAELLSRLVQEECDRDPPSDAVAFVGAAQHFRSSSETPEVTTASDRSVPFFYFEYSPHPGAEFPDAIERITRAAHGNVFHLHSPEDLADALAKMRKTLKAAP